MRVEAEVICKQSVAVQYRCANVDAGLSNVSSAGLKSPILCSSESSLLSVEVSVESPHSESALICSTSIQTSSLFETPTSNKFAPRIRSGSHTDIGPRRSNEDQHIQIDDLSSHLGSLYKFPQPTSFYAIFDGHGGSDASAFVKNNTMRYFFEDAQLPPQTSEIDDFFWQELENSYSKSFSTVDRALADELSGVDSYCGTTAITALVLGKHLLIANAGDCRAVLCRNGKAVQLSHDHRPSCPTERKRVEDLGGTIEFDYLNGNLAVTRSLGDWYMKLPFGSASPLSSEPEFHRVLLTEEDEFLILGCDGIWDVLSNQEAVSLVRRELRRSNDLQQCARELINLALRKDTCDNVTAVIISFSSAESQDSLNSQRPRLRFCMSEEARSRLRSLLEG